MNRKDSFMAGFRHAEKVYRIPKAERIADDIEQLMEGVEE